MSEEEKKEEEIVFKKKVDEDWKQQAQAEKDKIIDKEEKIPEASRMPGADFLTFISSIATQAMFSLGEIEHPMTKKKELNLDLAKYHIDSLDMLKQKTEGNLSDQETKELDNILYALKMKFSSASE